MSGFTKSVELSEVLNDCLHAYFIEKTHPQISYALYGTPFQKRVWQALAAIPWGQTASYGELASDLKSHARAIGQACKRNPISIIVPCHRVTSKTGLGGYGGHVQGKRWAIKPFLLQHEHG